MSDCATIPVLVLLLMSSGHPQQLSLPQADRLAKTVATTVGPARCQLVARSATQVALQRAKPQQVVMRRVAAYRGQKS